MSFSDMMSSARGPGVIGTLMALAVMAIFVMFFVFAVDDRFQGGGQTIESVIAQQAHDSDFIKSGIAEGRQTLSGVPALMVNSKELGRLKRENESLEGRIVALGANVELGKAELARRYEAFEDYKDQYRAFVRGKAKGESLATLETQSGTIYKNVNIREVTAIGIQIRHDDGQKRIPFEELPEAMKDYYQFDPQQKVAAVAKEQATWNEHEAAVSVANLDSNRRLEGQAAKDAEAAREKLTRAIAIKISRTGSLSEEIQSLEKAIPKEVHKEISNAPQMREQLANKRSALAALQADIARMQAELSN